MDRVSPVAELSGLNMQTLGGHSYLTNRMCQLGTLAFATICIFLLLTTAASPAVAPPEKNPRTPHIERGYEWVRLIWKVPQGTTAEVVLPATTEGGTPETRTLTRASSGDHRGQIRITISGLTNSTNYSFSYRTIRGNVPTKSRTAKVRTLTRYPGSFPNQSITMTPEVDSLQISWPRVDWAKKYSVAVHPLGSDAPETIGECAAEPGCRLHRTTANSLMLNATQLSTPTHTISSDSGNITFVRVFAHNGAQVRRAAEVNFKPVTGRGWLPRPNSFVLAARPVSGGLVSVGSYNIHVANSQESIGQDAWDKRLPKVARSIVTAAGSGTSVFALQEASHTYKRTGKPDSTQRQFAELEDEIERQSGNGNLKLVGSDNFADGDWFPGQTLSQDTRILYDSQQWSATTNPDAPYLKTSEAVDSDHRPAAWARLDSTTGKSPFCLVSVHLHATDQSIRQNQVATLIANMETGSFKQLCEDLPVVIGGDLNVYSNQTSNGVSYNDLRETLLQAGFSGAKSAQNRTNLGYNSVPTGTQISKAGTPFGLEHLQDGAHIDHILVRGSSGIQSLEAKIPVGDYWGQDGSDHLLIRASIGFNP